MDESPPPPAQIPAARHLDRREGKVFGFVDGGVVEALIAALTEAGFPADQIDVVTGEVGPALDAELNRPGFGGALERFLLSMGGDLDEIENARRELAAGYVLVAVPDAGDGTVNRVRDILREHGAHDIAHIGRWTITTFD